MPEPQRSPDEADRLPLRCSYFVLAQFDLDRLPVRGDSIFVGQGERVLRVAWR